MLDAVPTAAWPLLLGVIAFTALNILRVLTAWKFEAARMHQLKVETHTLRLRLKQQSAARIFAEEQHRASYSSHLKAA